MDSPSGFQDLISRARIRDPEASAELVHRYEPEIRRIIRSKLRDCAELRHLDSIDISQSVFCSLFIRLAAGKFEIADPARFLNLLILMKRGTS